MRYLSIAVLGLALVSTGCVRQQRFRFVPATSACFADGTGPGTSATGPADQKPSLDCRSARYKMAFVEFDSDGKTFDPAQEKAALRLIEQEKSRAPNGKIITVIYVHGWKNNASEAPPGAKPKDVEKFQGVMQDLGTRASKATDAASAKTPVPVVGIYIGWRGKTLMGPTWFTSLSLWGRRNTANHVGDGTDLAPMLNRMIEKTNEGSDRSRVLLIGHSFGARVLEHAIETKKVTLYDTVPDTGFVNPRVDLVLYVNSANDARLSMARVQDFRAKPLSVRHPDYDPAECAKPAAASDDAERRAERCRDYPLLVAITSTGDLATKYLLPLSSRINSDKNSAPMPVGPTGDDFADPVPSPGSYRRFAAAHSPFLQSHTAREILCPAFTPVASGSGAVSAKDRDENRRRFERAMHPVCSTEDSSCRFIFRTLGDRPSCFQVDQRTALDGKPPFNTTAFWIMTVEPSVIKDHGDIWNLSFVEMLGQLMAPRGFFDTGERRIQIRAASPK